MLKLQEQTANNEWQKLHIKHILKKKKLFKPYYILVYKCHLFFNNTQRAGKTLAPFILQHLLTSR